MPKFEILLKPAVEKDLRKFPSSVIRHVFEAIEQLADTPCIPPDKKLAGTERTWRHRIGDYRVIYELDLSSATIINPLCSPSSRGLPAALDCRDLE